MIDELTRPVADKGTEGRWDLYGAVHKGLRRAHALMLARLGSADFGGDTQELLTDLRRHLALSAIHLADEEEFIHPALEARVPGAPDVIEYQHEHHRAHMAAMAVEIRRISQGDDAPAAGRRLYALFTRFVADDLDHMAFEETVIFPLLCRHFSDEELMELEHAIVHSMTPEISGAFAAIMLAGANIDGRVALLRGMQLGMPAGAYADLFHSAVQPVCTPRELVRLSELGLAA